MRFSHGRKIILISNWKCGCSTLAALFDPVSEFDGYHTEECERIFGKTYDTMAHYPAKLIRQEFARKGWDFAGYTVISSVRNPWARAVSLYANVKRVGYDLSFDEFILNELYTWQSGLQNRWNTYEMFHERGRRLVDHVVRLEHLEADLKPVVDANWPDLDLDYSTRSNAGIHDPFRDYYTDQTREVVADFFAYDIETFGYGFDDPEAA